MAQKAKASGTSFSSREDAVGDFRSRYGSTYTSSFPVEPPTRPSYIPQSAVMDGQTVNIYYNPSYGGYGYVRNGAWRAYDALADAVVLDALLHQHNYYYGQSYYGNRYYDPYGRTVVVSHGASAFGSALLTLVVLVMIVVVIVIIVKARSQAAMRQRQQYVGDTQYTQYAPGPRPQYASPPPLRAAAAGAPPPMPDAAPTEDMTSAGFLGEPQGWGDRHVER